MESSTADPLIGKVLGDKYRIVERIGVGGMSTVYKAEHLMMNRIVALKILSKELSSDEVSGKRFLAEAKITSQLTHPNAVILHDAGVDEDTPYLVMEYLHGRTLKQMLEAKEPIPFKRLCYIMEQVCEALSEAHALGIIHRDLKPTNIMLLERDRVKVLDFGIAKMLNPGGFIPSDLTVTGALVGTPHYMSPEQGMSKPLTVCSDIYSLGVVLYELCTGKVPFDGPSSVVILIKHAQERPRPFHEVKPDIEIPEIVEKVVMRCLEKDPAARYQSVDELMHDLRPALPMVNEAALGGAAKRTGYLIGAALMFVLLAVWWLFGAGRHGDVQQFPVPVVDPVREEAQREAEAKRAAALQKVREELEAAKKAQAEAEEAKRAAEAATRKAQEEAQAAQAAQEQLEAARKAQVDAEEARRAAEEESRKTQAEAEARQKAQLEAEAAQKKAQADEQAKQKIELELEAAYKARADAQAKEKMQRELEEAQKAQVEMEAAKKKLAELEEAKRAAEETARKAQAEAAALKQAEEAKKRAQQEAEAKVKASRAASEAEERKAKQERVRPEVVFPLPSPKPVPSMPAKRPATPAPAPSVEPSREPPPEPADLPKPRRRCGPTWCM
jgi:tRNA A-37 threonylcarbamoyl transferase component Bud32